MKHEFKEEIKEIVEVKVHCGFDSEEDIFNIVEVTFYDEKLDEYWIKNLISEKCREHKIKSSNWEEPADFQKLVSIFDQLICEQIVSLHYAGYTKQDAGDECLVLADELQTLGYDPHGYCNYTEQDVEAMTEPNSIFYLDYGSIPHSNERKVEIGTRIVELLEQNGFCCEWDGSPKYRIGITNFEWKKTPDSTEYNYDRIFDSFEEHQIPKIDKDSVEKVKSWWKFWK